jgi:hypothetical protein
MFKAGAIDLIQPPDPVRGSSLLRVEVIDDEGRPIGHVDIDAKTFAGEDDCRNIQVFAFNVDEETRKPGYLEQYPLAEGEHNQYRIEQEMREDFDDWNLRQRRGRARYDGISRDVVAEWHRHR